MKKKLCLAVLLVATNSYAADDAKQAKNEWQNTTISEATIAKIQAAKYEYKKCVSDEMQKSSYSSQESRAATETIIKQCEPVLTKMRDVYLAEKVPEVIADRHLKQMRLQTTRDVLQNMMYGEAARSSGQSK
jgi:DNA mismatch repair protein MutH